MTAPAAVSEPVSAGRAPAADDVRRRTESRLAHDFKNLLGIVCGYSEVLLANLPAADGNRGLIAEIHAAGERAAAMTPLLFGADRAAAPVSEPFAPAGRLPAPPPGPAGVASDDRPGRVLVVDDEPAARNLVGLMLAGLGHAVDTVGGVDDALAAVRDGAYDVALIDLEMPGRTGLDLIAELAATGSDVVPVLLTGTRDVPAAVAGMKCGAFDYLPKPARAEAVRWTVQRAVGAARARRRERSLERVVGEWAATFDACPDMLLVLDPAGRVLKANRAAGAGAPAGRPVRDVLPGPLGDAVARRHAAGGPPATVADTAKDRYYLVSVDPVGSTGGAVAVVRDVTELVRAEAAQSKLSRQLLSAQEDERGRLARELHDGVGQAVVSLAVGLDGIAHATPPGPLRDRIGKLAGEATDTLDEIRRMAHGLRPAVLDDIGLEAALERLADQFTATHRVRAELVVPTSPVRRLPRGVEAAVYRIVQESLANVARHARAGTVDVTLEIVGDSVHVAVTDDGCGLPPPGASPGMGLSDMRERAAMFGGTVRVESSPGRGTTVDVRIPLGEAAP